MSLSPNFCYKPFFLPLPPYLYPSLGGVVMIEEYLACQWVSPYRITCQKGSTSCCWNDSLVTYAWCQILLLSRQIPLRHNLLFLAYLGYFPICSANFQMLGYMGPNWAKVVPMDMGLTQFKSQLAILGPYTHTHTHIYSKLWLVKYKVR